MLRLLACGAAAAAILAGGPAVAQTAQPTSPTQAQTMDHHRRPMRAVTRAQFEARVDAEFAKLDVNHDGFITRDEMNAFAARRQQEMAQRSTRFDPSKMFDRLDLNHDGKITVAEANAARDKHMRDHGRPAQQAEPDRFHGFLARADTNGDGVVTRAEFDAAVQQFKARFQNAGMSRGGMMERLFEAADTNKDGRVSLAEMKQAAMARFDRLDLNHDGTITPDEWKQAHAMFRDKHHKS